MAAASGGVSRLAGMLPHVLRAQPSSGPQRANHHDFLIPSSALTALLLARRKGKVLWFSYR